MSAPEFVAIPLLCTACELVPEYTGVTVEGLRGIGGFERSGPCGFYDADSDAFYRTKTTTRTIVTRDIDPAPPTYACDLVPGGEFGGTVRATTVGGTTHTFDYDSLVVDSVDPTENGGCSEPSADVTTDTYTLSYQVNHLFASDDDDCSGTFSPQEVPTTEIDPDLSTEDTSYSDPWSPLPEGDIKGGADAAMEEAFAAAEWTEGAALVRAELTSDEDGLRSASHSKASTRFHLIGGNTGHVEFDWEVRDQDGTLLDSGTEVHEWVPDPAIDLDLTIPGPDMTVDYPDTPAAGDFASNFKTLAIIAIRWE